MAAEAPSGVGGSGGGGAMFDADDLLFPSDGPALETESDWQRPQKAVSMAPVAPVRPAGPRVAPPPEPVEVLAFAAYGAAPDAWWHAPGYLYKVKMRQAALRQKLAERRDLAAKAAGSEEDAVASFGERIRGSSAARISAYVDAIRAIDAAEQVLRKEDSVLAAEMDAHALKLAGFDQRISPLEAELAHARTDLAQLESASERAEAMRKRAEIEARNLASRADAGARGAASERTVRDQLTRSTAVSAEAAERLSLGRRKTTSIQQRITDAKNERAAVDAHFKRKGNQRGAVVGEARKAYRKAVADLAEKALLDEASFGPEYAETRTQIERLRDALAARARDVALCEGAVDAYDKDVFQRGAMILLASAGAVLLLFGALFYFVAIGGTPAPATLPAPVSSS